MMHMAQFSGGKKNRGEDYFRHEAERRHEEKKRRRVEIGVKGEIRGSRMERKHHV